MATNNFKAFAIAGGANVTAQADYEALASLSSGFQSGKASSSQINKALRQGTSMAALLGQFIAAANVDALDNGNLTTLLANFNTALTTNLSLGTASKKNVGTGAGQIPDMSSFTGVIGASGYQSLPGGLILQWMNATAPDGATSGSVALPTAFPNNTLIAFVCDSITTGAPGNFNLAWSINTTTRSSISWVSTNAGVGGFTILAIGR